MLARLSWIQAWHRRRTGSAAAPALAGAIALAALLAAGCTRNVPQHQNSGKDYRPRDARPIVLEDGEARVRDIVTYPGGDRVDWKVVELPEEAQGSLQIKLRWRPPRPGLDLAFEVYDEYFKGIVRAKPSPGSGDRSKSVRVKRASGKYYIRVYASGRGDAGRYTLSLRFKERKGPPGLDELADLIDDPPVLPAVEAPVEKTAEELAQEEEDRKAAEAQALLDEQARLEEQARLDELNKPVFARVIRTQRSSSGVIITVSAGKNRDIQKGWRGRLLSGDSQNALPGGEFTVIRVTRSESIGKVQLSVDQVRANPRVELRRTGVN